MVFMFLDSAVWVIRHTDLLEKPFGVTHQVKPGRVPRVKSRIGADGAPGLETTGSTINDCFPPVSVGGTFPRHLFSAAGQDGGGVEIGFLRDVGVFGLQVIKTGEEFVVRAEGAPPLPITGSLTDTRLPFVSVGGTFPRHLVVSACHDGGGVKIGFLRDVGVFGLQVVETGEELVVRADGAPGLVITGSAANDCFPPVSVRGALPRHLLAAAGYNGRGVKIGFLRDVGVRGLQVVETCKDFLVGTDGAAPLVPTGSIGNNCFPFVPVSSALPQHLRVAAECNGGGVEHCLGNEFRVSGLQVVETCKDFLVGTDGAAPLVPTGSAINGCFPPVSVRGALPQHLRVAAGYNGRGVKIGFPRDVGVRGLQVVETCKDFLVEADGAPGLVITGSIGNNCFPFVPVGSALPWHLLAVAECNGGGVEHCLGNEFRVSLR